MIDTNVAHTPKEKKKMFKSKKKYAKKLKQPIRMEKQDKKNVCFFLWWLKIYGSAFDKYLITFN